MLTTAIPDVAVIYSPDGTNVCGSGGGVSIGYRVAHVVRYTGFLRVRENWKMLGNLSGQGKVRGKYFLEKSGRSQRKRKSLTT